MLYALTQNILVLLDKLIAKPISFLSRSKRTNTFAISLLSITY